jgi:hypothetical protein
MFDSADKNKRKLIGFITETGEWIYNDNALAGSIVYDSPDKARPCPDNFKSANGGQVCIREHNTPLIDSLSGNQTDFPRPTAPITTKNNTRTRLNREKSLTELFGGPL